MVFVLLAQLALIHHRVGYCVWPGALIYHRVGYRVSAWRALAPPGRVSRTSPARSHITGSGAVRGKKQYTCCPITKSRASWPPCPLGASPPVYGGEGLDGLRPPPHVSGQELPAPISLLGRGLRPRFCRQRRRLAVKGAGRRPAGSKKPGTRPWLDTYGGMFCSPPACGGMAKGQRELLGWPAGG